MFDLYGKLALVTGSSRGIGKAIAMKLAEAGASVIVHGRKNGEAAQNTVNEIRSSGGECYCIFGDTSDPEEVFDMFR